MFFFSTSSLLIFERVLKNIFVRGWSAECLLCGGKSRNPFAMILVPLERWGLRRHFELLYIKIHRRSSEKSSLELAQVVTFWRLFPEVAQNSPIIIFPDETLDNWCGDVILGLRDTRRAPARIWNYRLPALYKKQEIDFEKIFENPQISKIFAGKSKILKYLKIQNIF